MKDSLKDWASIIFRYALIAYGFYLLYLFSSGEGGESFLLGLFVGLFIGLYWGLDTER